MKQVEVRVDTGVLLKSMVDQARLVVLKAVATATNTSVRELPTIDEEKEKPAAATPEALGSFRNAMKLSRSEADPRLQKARTSALRLNRALHGKRTNVPPSSLGMRKVRSVKWNHPGQTPRLNATLAPTPKKQQMVQTAASKLKSFKSFGRPHAGDFGSGPRNATFGEYGGFAGGAGVWGRDGRLAHHPTPAQEVPAVDSMGNMSGGSTDQNATFDDHPHLHRASSAAAAASGAALLFGRTPSGGASGSSASSSSNLPLGASSSAASMQRTATALENTLMKKWSS